MFVKFHCGERSGTCILPTSNSASAFASVSSSNVHHKHTFKPSLLYTHTIAVWTVTTLAGAAIICYGAV